MWPNRAGAGTTEPGPPDEPSLPDEPLPSPVAEEALERVFLRPAGKLGPPCEALLLGETGEVSWIACRDRSMATLDGEMVVVTVPVSRGALTYLADALVVRSHPDLVLRVCRRGEADQVQRRAYYRVRADLAATLWPEDGDRVRTRSLDLSAGGTRLADVGGLRPGEVVRVTLELSDG
ncbi:MAG: PilZ domain-containing protein, partial [Acidimicrobiales bacterium]